MVEAFVLIHTEIAKPPSVAAAGARIDGVTTAVSVTGPFDVIARVQAEDVLSLGRPAVSQIHDVPGGTRTLTCLSSWTESL